MGQKISIHLFRAKKRMSKVHNKSAEPTQLQQSVWFAKGRSYSKLLLQDKEIRDYIQKNLSSAGVVNIVIKRYFKKVEVVLFTTRPGIIIGRQGSTINKIKNELVKKFNLPADLRIDIQEFKDANRSSKVIAEDISGALAKGIPFRRLAKIYLEKIRYAGIIGARITLSGRLNGAEIARREEFAFGSIPRHTIDSNIDYALVHAPTKTGVIGVKVWLYKGDKFKDYTY
jgi:small subunit ribosomal protein S3